MSPGFATRGDKRDRTRVQTRHVGFLVAGDKRIPFEAEDVSLKGMLVHPAEPLDATRCTVELPLAADLVLRIDAEVVRSRHGAALLFVGMDEEVYGHLRRLVQLSAEDADRIEAEETTPAFLHRLKK